MQRLKKCLAYFKLLLGDIVPIWLQKLQNQRNDVPATEVVSPQGCEECVLSFVSDLKKQQTQTIAQKLKTGTINFN